jgi:hypothetical protein
MPIALEGAEVNEMLTRISLRTVGFALVAMGVVAVVPAHVEAQTPTKVYPYPGDQSWFPMTSGWAALSTLDGYAQITGDQPYGGNGSLRLAINGGLWLDEALPPEPGFFDWGFYGTLAQEESWGRLGDISDLSMVWRREGPDVGLPAGDPWAAQTPVLRLLLGDESGLLVGELVWEKFYTNTSYLTPYGGPFHEENMFGQKFWHNSGSGDWMMGLNGAYIDSYTGGTQYLVNSGCQDWAYQNAPTTLWPGGLVTGNVGQWSHPEDGLCALHLSDTYVWGMAVGVGSRWPDNYLGYVDYVRLDFNEENAVYANFELPETTVPEPGTIVLLATGLLGLGGAKLLRRRR